jgi:L-iditol 2-dehydrogenase
MDAFVKHGRAAGAAAVRPLPEPEPGPGQVLVRVAACGICGSDLHAWRSDPGYEWIAVPVVLGHEFAGVVTAVGPGVDEVAAGDAVVAVSIQGCLHCDVCRAGATQLCPRRRIIGLSYDGGLAEQVVVPAAQLVRVPDGLDLRRAAMAEPLSVAVHAVLGRARIQPGQTVVVTGPGPIGLLCAQLAARCGGAVLVAGAPADAARRLPIAEGLGLAVADVGRTSLEQAVRDRFGRPPDAWIEASGAVPALRGALTTVRWGGTITVVSLFADALEFRPTDAVRAELTVLFSYASSHPDYVTALRLLAEGDVDADPLIDAFPLADAGAAFEAAATGRAVKPMIVAEQEPP